MVNKAGQAPFHIHIAGKPKVTLEGLVKNKAQRQMAESDAWYVFRVDRVVNLLQAAE